MAMTAHQRMAALSDLLPETGMPRRGWRALMPRFSRRPRGLAAIPERYRLQFLLLADAAMPGSPQAEVAAMAGRLADRVKVPGRLAARRDTGDLDAWFKNRTDQIRATLAGLLEAEAR